MASSRSLEIRPLASGEVGLLEALSTVFGAAFDEADTYTGARPRGTRIWKAS